MTRQTIGRLVSVLAGAAVLFGLDQGLDMQWYIAIPIAVPTIPSSDNGVSKQRDLPKAAVNPSVARNTPPFGPTSSPNTTTDSSLRMAVFRPSLTA